MLFFEDFRPGEVATYPGPTVSRDAIVAFATEFDPQPMHVDEAAARATMLGTLIASGWHTAALNMRMIADDFVLNSAGMGSPGLDWLKWLRPVFPGDTLSGHRTVMGATPSATRPDRGYVKFRFDVLNQRGEPVMEQVNSIIIGRREPGAPGAPGGSGGSATARSRADEPGIPALDGHGSKMDETVPYFEELEPGLVERIGSRTFSAQDIIRFALDYDPQPFHVDPAAAETGPFGGLIASGWHTAAVWMRLMVDHRRRQSTAGLDRLGPSPGFRDARWVRPVRAGDTIVYHSTVLDCRVSGSRPGWGLVTHRNTGHNQTGHLVFAFDGAVFWKRRPEKT